MNVLNASDAKREFGEMLLKVQSTPIGINRNGKPVAVVVSVAEYEQLESCRDACLKAAIDEGVADVRAGNVSTGTAVMARLRERIS